MKKYRMLDLFSGLGGASKAMIDRGWEVIRVDIEPKFRPTLVRDILSWRPEVEQGYFDLVWASPPCTYYSRYLQRGVFKNEPVPSLDLYNASKEIIKMLCPRFYVIECVRGAVPFFGSGYRSYGSFFLWSNLPEFPAKRSKFGYVKSGVNSGNKKRASDRARIPYELSQAVAVTVESMQVLPGFELPMVWAGLVRAF